MPKKLIDRNHPIYQEYRDSDANYRSKGKKKFEVVSKEICKIRRANSKGNQERNV
jgi:hypothetical protein